METPQGWTETDQQKTVCPKCQSEKIVVADQNDKARGVANSDRGPHKPFGHYRKALFRCLDCNHKWAEYFA